MPFPWTEHYAYYASPLKMFEYMAGNRPVVASELPVVTEVLEHGRDALLVPPDDAPALANAIGRLIDDTALGARLAAAAFAKVQTRSWAARAESILSFMAARIAGGK